MQGIGDSSQGWANATLYIFASSFIRKKHVWEPIKKGTKKLFSSKNKLKSQNCSYYRSIQVAPEKINLTETGEVALPPDMSKTVSYPSETYFSIPYTSIGLLSGVSN